jgi:RecT family
MNDLSTVTNDIQGEVSAAALMMNPTSMQSLVAFAEMMSKATATVPAHIVSGRLGYEAQLVNAVIMASRAIEGTFHYEYRGEAQNLECRVGATPRGEAAIVWGEWLRNGDVTTRNSPLWKTNVKQQLAYLQVKNWARLYCPGAILGVYTADELQDGEAPVRRGPQRRSAAPAPAPLVDEVPKSEQNPAPAAPAAKQDPPPSGNGISGGQVAYLRNKLTAAGVSEPSICDRFQIGSIELLSAEQFAAVKAELLALA